MFRRKDEGMADSPAETGTVASPEVQVPPAAQGQGETMTTNAAPNTTASPYAMPSGASSYSAATSYSAGTTTIKPAVPVAPAAPAANAASTPATPYRAPAPAANSAGSNVTELPGRSASPARFGETRSTTGNTMDKPASKSGTKNRILTVGNDILMKGEINSCDRIVIEGAVDATLKDVHTMEIAESGSFKGMAEVEEAEISGTVEGDLTVRGRLIIYSTGKVTGKVSYGEIEIERGGQLTGEIKTSSGASSISTKAAAA